ncbi:discoidin domain-containing protein [Rubritalea tangerina]|uniref:Discoidin domain-containing protein n=1 Tax=Rubritalea tangerina TaxID=430798 RepID=A0ABW4ZAE9_9BACT
MKHIISLLLCISTLCWAAQPSAEALLKQATIQLIDETQLSGPQATAFSEALSSSPAWQRELLDSGEIAQPSTVLKLLFEIWKGDPDLTKTSIDRAMATACALEAPRKNWDAQVAIQRYQYFSEKSKLGLLNSMYAELTPFQRRYLARGVQHGHLNHIESLEYQNLEVCLPSERYTGACWYARWILLNPFGDSIHGPMYYQPFRESYTSAAEMIRKVGGVCGSLSNFGAAAAIANGVPAATMGEPGHCAYTVMTKPHHWQPAYSLSWKRGLHSSYYGGSWGWHVFNNKGQENLKAAYKAADLRRLAQFQISKRQIPNAFQSLKDARKTNPFDWQNWLLTAEIYQQQNATKAQWKALHDEALKLLAPHSGEVAWHLFEKHIYPHIIDPAPNYLSQRKETLLAFQQAISGWGLARWNYAQALNQQLKLLSKDTQEQDKYVVRIFGIHAKDNIFTPVIFEEQLKRVDKDPERRQAFIASLGKGLSKSNNGDFSAVIDTMAKSVLPDAAKREDKATFQYIGKLTQKNYEKSKVEHERFPGILLSSGGTMQIDQPGNRWDNPARHWGVIENYGGSFHTGSNKPFVQVQLGNFGRLSGVVIITRNGHVGRLNGAILQTSSNGKDWTDVHTFKNVSQVNRIPLAEKKIDAGYVRVSHPNGQPLHFIKFLTYGKKQN